MLQVLAHKSVSPDGLQAFASPKLAASLGIHPMFHVFNTSKPSVFSHSFYTVPMGPIGGPVPISKLLQQNLVQRHRLLTEGFRFSGQFWR